MTTTITLNNQHQNPEVNARIQNAIEGFDDNVFLEDYVSRETYRNLKVSDVNTLLCQLTHYRHYSLYYKVEVLNKQLEITKLCKEKNGGVYDKVVFDELVANDNDYLLMCNSCMILNEQ